MTVSDLISRADAIEVLTETIAPPSVTLDTLVMRIDALPSAEPKTGEWIKATGMMPPEFHGHHCCSECDNFANMEPPFGNREDLSKFCPNCGARMYKDGEDE